MTNPNFSMFNWKKKHFSIFPWIFHHFFCDVWDDLPQLRRRWPGNARANHAAVPAASADGVPWPTECFVAVIPKVTIPLTIVIYIMLQIYNGTFHSYIYIQIDNHSYIYIYVCSYPYVICYSEIYGDFHSHGGSPIAGLFISWNI